MAEKVVNEKEYLKGLIEAILFVQVEPISYKKLAEMIKNSKYFFKKSFRSWKKGRK